MPKLLRGLLSKSPKGRRLSASRSTGDLLGLIQGEYASKPIVPSLNINDIPEVKSPFGSAVEDLVVCGFLYRLTPTGIWFRLWVELRFNYLMGFYERTDVLPIDVINLDGYVVRKAEECDHLEGLYPMKLTKKGQTILFFYTESEESRMEWMSNLKKTANQEKMSLNIEGLNLEFETRLNEGVVPFSRRNSIVSPRRRRGSLVPRTGRRNSLVIRNIEKKVINDVTVIEEENDEMKENLTLQARPNPKSVKKIRTKYERAEVLTQHEALRLSTYYSQRRLSTQAKVSTLEEMLEESHKSSPLRIKTQLEELRQRLNDLDNEREKTERAMEHMFQELEFKRVAELKSVHADLEEEEEEEEDEEQPKDDNIQIKIIEHQPPKEIANDASTTTVMRRLKLKSSKDSLKRHTFSPGDWLTKHFDTNSLRKSTSSSISDIDALSPVETSSPKSKRPSPLKILSNAVRSKREKGYSSSPPSTPITPSSPKSKSSLMGKNKSEHSSVTKPSTSPYSLSAFFHLLLQEIEGLSGCSPTSVMSSPAYRCSSSKLHRSPYCSPLIPSPCSFIAISPEVKFRGLHREKGKEKKTPQKKNKCCRARLKWMRKMVY